MHSSLYLLDLVGTFAFAIIGAYKALEKHFNVYGVFTCAALTSLGGGTIREIVLHHLPFYFVNHSYVYVTLAGALLAMQLHRNATELKSYILLIDAIGLTAFAFIGAQKAEIAGLGLIGMVFFATLTAAGGGILADVVTGNRPIVFLDDFYIFPAAIGGGLFFYLLHTPHYLSSHTAIALVLVLPLAIRVGWLAQRGELAALQSSFERYLSLLRQPS